MLHHLKLRKSSNSTLRRLTLYQLIFRQKLKKQFLPSQRQWQSSRARKRLKSPRRNPRQLALSNFSESRTSRKQRMTRSLRRLKRITNPKSPAVLTSPTETSHQRNLTARKTTFPISKHGRPSLTHG
jgi:hypothetical protein